MSRCPQCGAKARHQYMVVPMEDGRGVPPHVWHVCMACDPLDGFGFVETALDPHAIVDSALAAAAERAAVHVEVEPCPSCGSTNPNECQHDCTNTVRIEVSKKGAT